MSTPLNPALLQQIIGSANAPLPKPTVALPIFAEEGPDNYTQAYSRNAPFSKPAVAVTTPGAKGPYQTKLSPAQESQFQSWVAQNKIPFDASARIVDYDMRGFWLHQQQDASAQGRAANGHFPDTYKTPYDTTFSDQSRYSLKTNPQKWVGTNLIDTRTGQVISR